MPDFSAKDLKRYRKMLEERRDEVLFNAKNAVDEGKLSGGTRGDEADKASHASEVALAWRLLDKDRKLLREIEHALKKFDDGGFGYCEGTGKAINKKRLEIRPWTRYSIDYKSELEKEKKKKRVGEGTKIDTLF